MAPIRTGWRIGFDIGGTFTDFVLFNGGSGAMHLHKRLTSSRDPSEAALAGLRELTALANITLADVDEIAHGTTLVTNAVIERKGARLGLLTTRGFRDILEMGTEQRYDVYDLFLGFPEPLVSRDLRLEVPERIDRDGRIVLALDPDDVRARLRELLAAGVEAVAVCLINAYRNPEHEQVIGRIARAEFPELDVSLSSEVVPELWEYQRCVTTCANAFVQPLADRYLQRIERELQAAGFRGSFLLMHSAGGLLSPAAARAFPIRLLESGPAGGALATAFFGSLAGVDDVFSFDMGGTTAKACLIEDGRAAVASVLEADRVHRFTRGSGLPIKTPAIEMIEIGAGGGSIAAIDEVGLLKVGPLSAGSNPGPACYGLGGAQPTVTDANLLLGYYDPGFFLGGRMALDRAAAAEAMAPLAASLGLSVEEAAWGVHKIVVENMAAAARIHLVEKGKDPRRYSMVGFGGAGPAHAAGVARALGMREVIVPPASGAASALGFLSAPLSFETMRSQLTRLSEDFDASAVNTLLAELEAAGRERLRRAGIAERDITVERSADMRLVGQLHDISVPLPDGSLDAGSVDGIRHAFEAAYSQRYTAVFEGAGVEAISYRVRCAGPQPELVLQTGTQAGSGGAARKGTRRAWFGQGFVDAAVYDRYRLAPGDEIEGPAIVEEQESTTVVPPGDHLTVDRHFNLCIAVSAPTFAGFALAEGESLAESIAAIEADPVSLEIMWSRLVNVTEEMWQTVCRTAFSLVISEAQDFACELLDTDGEPVAHSPRAMPAFNLALPRAVKAMLERYPVETLQSGDVLITNDPWLCAGHLFDIAVVTPVFRNGKVIGLAGTVGHVNDIGGTRDTAHAREIFDEGLQIPPMKLFEAGQPNETLFRLIGENVRNPEQVIGDIRSLVAANDIGARRILEFVRDYGLPDLQALTRVVQDRSEAAMRRAIAAIPDGVYESELWSSPHKEVLRYPLKLTVAGDSIELDFEGSAPQLEEGGFNATLNYTTAHATYPLKCILTPNVRGNSGCYRPFTVKAPEGSILNARRPAAVGMRTRSGWCIAPNVFRALAEAVPDKVQAATGLASPPGIYGLTAEGETYSDMFFAGGGQGAWSRGDGKSGLLWPTSAANTSVELFEARIPLLVEEKAFLPDTGGPGMYRGGLAQRLRFRKLLDDAKPMFVTVFPERARHPGLFGGHAGAGSHACVIDPAGNVLQDCGGGGLVRIETTGEIMEIVMAGGAGFGRPEDRTSEAVMRDLAFGLITPESAARDYGFSAEDRTTGDSTKARQEAQPA